MGQQKLLIHFQPGARGDFLASVLLDSFYERNRFALRQPSLYRKIHHIELLGEHTWNDIEQFNGIKVRIDANSNPVSLVEIAVNNLIKNAPEHKILDYFSIYMIIVNFLNNEMNNVVERKNLYTHWIDFQSLKDINFLKELYFTFNHKEIQPDLLEKIINNINNQLDISKDIKLMNLAKLLEFELKNNCTNNIKYFNFQENLEDIDKYLDLKYYSNELEQY